MAKYFTDEEIEGLVPEAVEKADKARGFAGFPFILNSGFRTKEKNDQIGGAKDSAHLYGFAMDFKRPVDTDLVIRMCWALGLAGFRRVEVCDKHIHADVDPNKQQDIMWFGVSR
jgi:hypothetical protein